MQGPISETQFIDILKDGIGRTTEFKERLTNWHGGPTKTEYLLTTDIARAFLDRYEGVRVECPNKVLINGYTQRREWSPRQSVGNVRTDVVVASSGILPEAMVEIKVGVGGKLGLVKEDLAKIANTLECMKTNIAARVRAASVFEVHVSGNATDITTDRLKRKIATKEASLQLDLRGFATGWPEFDFRFVSLQDQDKGYVPTEIEREEDGSESLGQDGHATRYYAVLITSIRKPLKANTLRERLQGD